MFLVARLIYLKWTLSAWRRALSFLLWRLLEFFGLRRLVLGLRRLCELGFYVRLMAGLLLPVRVGLRLLCLIWNLLVTLERTSILLLRLGRCVVGLFLVISR